MSDLSIKYVTREQMDTLIAGGKVGTHELTDGVIYFVERTDDNNFGDWAVSQDSDGSLVFTHK